MRNPYADQMKQACCDGDANTVRAMLRQGADVNAPVWEDTTALRWATVYGHLDTVKVLLVAGADVNAQSSHGTVLSLAEASSAKDEAKIVYLLKRAGARE